MMNDLQYNYVLFGSSDDYYMVAYNELFSLDYVYCIMDGIDTKNKILNTLYKIHTSKRTQSFVKLPFKSIWNNRIFRHSFNNDKPICFVFFSRNQLCTINVIRYLKRLYPNSKFVAFWQDLVCKINLDDFALLKESYLDLCLSFDQGDSERYGMQYYPLVYSDYSFDRVVTRPKSDVYFVGKAKDRLGIIIEVFEYLNNAGLNCDFNITGVAKKDRVYADKISYIDSMPYKDNIEHIKATNCMLEIMQGGGTGFTLRYAEAIMFNKKMITNNQLIKNADFYDAKKINVFKNVNEIDVNFPISLPINVDYDCKEKLYPSRMIEYIDTFLSRK